jgi:hypothetical protein
MENTAMASHHGGSGPKQSFTLRCGNRTVPLSTDNQYLARFIAHTFKPFIIAQSAQTAKAAAGRPQPAAWSAEVAGKHFSQPSFVKAATEIEYVIDTQLLATQSYSVVLHGAAVSGSGHQIVMLGAPFSGKTTLALELVLRGYTFLGDEYVVFDKHASALQPFPKSTFMREIVGQLPVGAQLDLAVLPQDWWYFLPDDRAPITPLAISDLCFVLPTHRNTGGAHVRRLRHGEILAQLISSAHHFHGHEAAVWPILASLAQNSCALAFEYSDLACLDQVLAELDGERASESKLG